LKLDPAGLLFQSSDGGLSIAAKRHGAIIHFFTRDAGALDSFARSNLGMGAPIEPCTGVVEGGKRLMFSAPEEWTLSSDTPLSVSTLKSLPPSVRWVEVTDGYVTFSAQGVYLHVASDAEIGRQRLDKRCMAVAPVLEELRAREVRAALQCD